MVYNIGINFRLTSGYVTDPTDTTYSLGETYPTTRSTAGTGQSVTFGWSVSPGGNTRDRSTSVDPRLAGLNWIGLGGSSTFRIDLPASGTWMLNFAGGDATSTKEVCYDILDSDNSTVLVSRASASLASGEFKDATHVTRTTAADWVTNNASINITLSGTSVYFRMAPTGANAAVSHIRLYQAGSLPSVTIDDATTTNADGTVTVQLHISPAAVGGETFNYATADGTASAPGYYTPVSGTVTLTPGQTSHQIVITHR